MRKIIYVLVGIIVAFTAFAQDKPVELNKVILNLSADEWVATDTARVVVNVDATLNQEQLNKVHADIMDNLKKISAKADWHITSFNRSADKSGLEKVLATAEARLPQNELAGLRDRAKSITRPGINYEISDIQFTPSLADMEKAKADLRQEIYKGAAKELDRLNQVYANEHFYLNKIDFIGVMASTNSSRLEGQIMAYKVAGPAPEMQVSNKLVLNAIVQLAAKTN